MLDPQKWIDPGGGTVWIPQWGVSGALPINWMGVAFQKQRHRNRKMMKHEDIQPTPKKTWENGKPSLCYCQLCQTRSSRCLRRNRTWEALVRHWQWANHHPQLSGRKSTSPTSAELVTLQGHGAHGSWIGCESWIKDAFEISLTYNSFHNKTIFSGKTPHILKNHVCPWIPCGSLRPPTGSPGIHGPVGLVGRVGADWRAYQKSPKG